MHHVSCHITQNNYSVESDFYVVWCLCKNLREKIRVALIYKNNYTFYNKQHFDKTTYYFFMESLKRNNELDIKYIPCNDEYDCSKLKGNTVIILLANNNTDATPA